MLKQRHRSTDGDGHFLLETNDVSGICDNVILHSFEIVLKNTFMHKQHSFFLGGGKYGHFTRQICQVYMAW